MHFTCIGIIYEFLLCLNKVMKLCSTTVYIVYINDVSMLGVERVLNQFFLGEKKIIIVRVPVDLSFFFFFFFYPFARLEVTKDRFTNDTHYSLAVSG